MVKLADGKQYYAANCEWIDDRWHLDGRPIHAGCQMELLFPDDTWQRVRVESEEHGRVLVAYIFFHKQPLTLKIGSTRKLRWPQVDTHEARPVDPARKLLAEIVDDASPCTSGCSRMVDERLIEKAAELCGMQHELR